MSMFKPDHNYKDFLTGAVLGGTLGAITALMCTEKGKKIQKELIKKYHQVENEIHHFQSQAQKKLSQGKATIKKTARKAAKIKSKAKRK